MARVIPAKEIIQALSSGPVHHCENCAARMFVQSRSGLCPVCFNDKEGAPLTIEKLLEDVLDETLPEAVEIPPALRAKLPAQASAKLQAYTCTKLPDATAPIRRRALAAQAKRDEAAAKPAAPLDAVEIADPATVSAAPAFDPNDPFAELAWIDSDDDSAGFEALAD